jgi:hypothetical protein
MPTQGTKTDASSGKSSDTPAGPGQSLMAPVWIAVVALYLVISSFLVLYGLLKLWPHPTPSGEPKVEGQAGVLPTLVGSTPNGPTPAQTTSPLARAATGPPPEGTQPSTYVVTTPTLTPTPAPSQTASATQAPAPNYRTGLPDPELISFFGGWVKVNVYAETRLLLLVMLAGALGSLMHSLRSLYWYTGNREMVWSWVGFYLLLPFTGAILAVIFYFVVRGGFFSPQASFENTSPFGFAALSALVGLFSPQATLKLKEVAETIFTKPGSGLDSKTQTSSDEVGPSISISPPPTVSPVTPASGPVAGDTRVVITGTGFASGVAVKFGDVPAVVTASTNTTIEAVTPASLSGPGVVDVEITNPDGQTLKLSQGYTYLHSEAEL